MSRVSFASYPYMLGFEELDRLVERTHKASSDGYPPFNIEQRDDQSYRITLAVAGFREEDLAITIEDAQLVVRGKQQLDEDRVYLHRGIAARSFSWETDASAEAALFRSLVDTGAGASALGEPTVEPAPLRPERWSTLSSSTSIRSTIRMNMAAPSEYAAPPSSSPGTRAVMARKMLSRT